MQLTQLIFDTTDEIFINEAQVFEMARVKPKDSGIPWIIFISSKDYVKQKHWARIKISNVKGTFSENDNFVVSISQQPKVLAGKAKMKQTELDDIFDWVVLNYDVLIKYWNEQFDSDAELYQQLRKI